VEQPWRCTAAPSTLTSHGSFESFVALALEDERLVVSEAVQFRV